MGIHRKIVLADDERQQLDRLIRSGTAKARELARTRVLLLSDRSLGVKRSVAEVANAALVSRGTVQNVCHRFLDEGLSSALSEKPRPGQKPKVTGDVEARLIALTCSTPPEGHARWTLRLLAGRLVELQLIESISHTAVGERLKKRAKTLAGR